MKPSKMTPEQVFGKLKWKHIPDNPETKVKRRSTWRKAPYRVHFLADQASAFHIEEVMLYDRMLSDKELCTIQSYLGMEPYRLPGDPTMHYFFPHMESTRQ